MTAIAAKTAVDITTNVPKIYLKQSRFINTFNRNKFI